MYVKVIVETSSKRESVIKGPREQLLVCTRAQATHNAANLSVREILARWYNVPVGRIRIENGHHSPRKMVEILEIDN